MDYIRLKSFCVAIGITTQGERHPAAWAKMFTQTPQTKKGLHRDLSKLNIRKNIYISNMLENGRKICKESSLKKKFKWAKDK